jgi:hypothetical protein
MRSLLSLSPLSLFRSSPSYVFELKDLNETTAYCSLSLFDPFFSLGMESSMSSEKEAPLRDPAALLFASFALDSNGNT